MAVSFEVGDTFSSYKDLKNRVEEFEKINFVQLAHRDSGTLAAAAKRAPKVVEKANKELVYYSIVLTCVLGGKKHKCEGSGVRPTQKTIKQGCPASVKLCLTEDCQQLTVSHVNMNHNHDVNKEMYSHLPRQRQLNSTEKDEAKVFLGMKANKKLLQQHLSSSGKVVTLKTFQMYKEN
ncbi:uncharacterized protein [Dysidea avara]|uniref:uncharacterized protein n=1 Tax=Dysidea avara TaxID=196820 RepID=UPI00331FCC73